MTAANAHTPEEWRVTYPQSNFHKGKLFVKEANSERLIATLYRARLGAFSSELRYEERLAYGRLIASAPALLAALQAVHDWRGLCDEDDLTTFERIAAQFKRETGMLRPGKDQAASLGGYPTDEQRRAAWDDWVRRKNDELNAQIRTALAQAQKGTP